MTNGNGSSGQKAENFSRKSECLQIGCKHRLFLCFIIAAKHRQFDFPPYLPLRFFPSLSGKTLGPGANSAPGLNVENSFIFKRI